MKPQAYALTDDFDDPFITIEEDEEAHEEDLWFLPGPLEEEPDDLLPGPRAEPPDTAVIDDWCRVALNCEMRNPTKSTALLCP